MSLGQDAGVGGGGWGVGETALTHAHLSRVGCAHRQFFRRFDLMNSVMDLLAEIAVMGYMSSFSGRSMKKKQNSTCHEHYQKGLLSFRDERG